MPSGSCSASPIRDIHCNVALTIPLNNKAAKADYERAVNEKGLSESRLNVTRQQIALEVRNALTMIEQARASIDTAQIARELAKEQADAEQTRFNLGTSTLRFVLEEQRNMAQAETIELQSLVTFNKALVDLDKAMGLTLMKNNVQLDKAIQDRPIASRTLTNRRRRQLADRSESVPPAVCGEMSPLNTDGLSSRVQPHASEVLSERLDIFRSGPRIPKQLILHVESQTQGPELGNAFGVSFTSLS